MEGQRLTKVDRSDDIVPTKKVDRNIAAEIQKRRSQEPYKMTQAQLAQKTNLRVQDIQTLESTSGTLNQQHLSKVERVLNWKMRSGEKLNDNKP